MTVGLAATFHAPEWLVSHYVVLPWKTHPLLCTLLSKFFDCLLLLLLLLLRLLLLLLLYT